LRSFSDLLFASVTGLAAISVIAIAIGLVWTLYQGASLSISSFGLSFITSTEWNPEPSRHRFGALAFLYGTVVTSAIALIIAVPLGVAVAIFLSEFCPRRLRPTSSFLIEMLAAIPSVVYGFWGIMVFAPWFQNILTLFGAPNYGGVGILTASIILAIMVLPYIASVSFDMLQAVPAGQRQACLALGATRWQMIRDVLLPNARPGILGGCFLALGRALGETMAVTMLIGNRSEISAALWGPGSSIASVIANEFPEAAYDIHTAALFHLSVLLLVITVLINTIARLLIRRSLRITAGPRWRHEPATPVCATQTDQSPLATLFEAEKMARAHRRNRAVNKILTFVFGGCFALTVTPLFLILGYLVLKGVGGLSWEFFTALPAPIGESGGGIGNAILGSVILVGLASLMAVPIGILAAVYVVEFHKTGLARTVRFIGELLSGVPSIVVGIFIYAVIVKPSEQFSGWAGATALAVLMLPVLLRAGEEALRLAPKSLKEGSYALGAGRWQTTVRVTIPAVLPALVTAVFLAVARVAGETAPLLLTASSSRFWPTSPSDFMPSLPVYIYNYSISPFEEWHKQAWAAALVLLSVVMILNFSIRRLTKKGMKAFRVSAE
jgi:phosphate transport system permease protein